MTLESEQHLRDPVRQLGPDKPTANADSDEIRLVTDALGELKPSAEQCFDVYFYDRLLLTAGRSLWHPQP
jgi:hypothetical protein